MILIRSGGPQKTDPNAPTNPFPRGGNEGLASVALLQLLPQLRMNAWILRDTHVQKSDPVQYTVYFPSPVQEGFFTGYILGHSVDNFHARVLKGLIPAMSP